MDEELAAEAVKSVDRTDVRVDETLHAASEIGTTARSSTVKQSMQRESEEADDSDALRISKIDLDAEDPIGDFNKKLGSRSFEVEDVIDALCALVRKTVESSFGSNDYTNARDMLIALRKNAIEVSLPVRALPNARLNAFSCHHRSMRKHLDTIHSCAKSSLTFFRPITAKGGTEAISGTTMYADVMTWG